MAVPVNDRIQSARIFSGHGPSQICRRTRRPAGLIAHMCHSDDHVRSGFFQMRDLRFRRFDLICELHAIQAFRIRRRSSMYRRKSEEADLYAVAFDHRMTSLIAFLRSGQEKTAVPVYIGRDHRELCQIYILKKCFRTEIKLMVARHHKIIIRQIHQFDHIIPFCERCQRKALRRIARVHKDRIFIRIFQPCDQRQTDDRLTVAFQIPVGIICMVNGNFCNILFRSCPGLSFCKRRHCRRRQHKTESSSCRQDAMPLASHIIIPSFSV